MYTCNFLICQSLILHFLNSFELTFIIINHGILDMPEFKHIFFYLLLFVLFLVPLFFYISPYHHWLLDNLLSNYFIFYKIRLTYHHLQMSCHILWMPVCVYIEGKYTYVQLLVCVKARGQLSMSSWRILFTSFETVSLIDLELNEW